MQRKIQIIFTNKRILFFSPVNSKILLRIISLPLQCQQERKQHNLYCHQTVDFGGASVSIELIL